MINLEPYISILQLTFEVFPLFALTLEQVHRGLSPSLDISTSSPVLGVVDPSNGLICALEMQWCLLVPDHAMGTCFKAR